MTRNLSIKKTPPLFMTRPWAIPTGDWHFTSAMRDEKLLYHCTNLAMLWYIEDTVSWDSNCHWVTDVKIGASFVKLSKSTKNIILSTFEYWLWYTGDQHLNMWPTFLSHNISNFKISINCNLFMFLLVHILAIIKLSSAACLRKNKKF